MTAPHHAANSIPLFRPLAPVRILGQGPNHWNGGRPFLPHVKLWFVMGIIINTCVFIINPLLSPYRWSITYLLWLAWSYLKEKFVFLNLTLQVLIKSTVETLSLKEPLLLNSTTARTTSIMWSRPSSSCWNSLWLISGMISFTTTDLNVFLLQV